MKNNKELLMITIIENLLESKKLKRNLIGYLIKIILDLKIYEKSPSKIKEIINSIDLDKILKETKIIENNNLEFDNLSKELKDIK